MSLAALAVLTAQWATYGLARLRWSAQRRRALELLHTGRWAEGLGVLETLPGRPLSPLQRLAARLGIEDVE